MQEFSTFLAFYIPLGIIGAWRWGTWIVKKSIGLFYQPDVHEFQAPLSVVTPVYNEDPATFRRALYSWKDNAVDEIIAVIDVSDKNCIAEFESFRKSFSGAMLIVTEKPGKRPALADGITAATGEFVALVDSDVIWAEGVRRISLRPFADPGVAGVGVRQNILEPRTLAQKIFDIQLDMRFNEDMLSSAVAGTAFTCLSGRTAVYRRKVILPMLDALVNESFWGKQCIGGDDKRLTYLVQADGWKCRYQHNARTYTRGYPELMTLFNQRIRWSRNSWRADLRALWQGWVWKQPFLAFLLLDRTVSNFTLLLSLAYFIISLALHLWLPALVLLVWWLFSRGVRMIPNLMSYPGNLRLVPFYIGVNFTSAIIRIYGLLTLNRQEWKTRGTRGQSAERVSLYLARTGTVFILVAILAAVYLFRISR